MRPAISANSNVPPPSGIVDRDIAGPAATGTAGAPVRASAGQPRASASLQPQAQGSSVTPGFPIVQEGDAAPADHAMMTIKMRAPQDDFLQKVAAAAEISYACEIKLLEAEVEARTKEQEALEAEVKALRLACAKQQTREANAPSQ
ncbi:hypothetical protein [Bordetella sp. LUAb4]|uniref:hypothetical protein n=1 Tax=Bordetella sp. LUAb4 TaxID=2843195 RepID=UPI001E3C1DCF|nr:hypothetical protein [Bordetella sp. LUAb4]